MYYIPGGTVWASRSEDNSGCALSLSLAFGVEMVAAHPLAQLFLLRHVREFPTSQG